MKKKIQIAVGCLLGIGLMFFVFRGTDWGEVLKAIWGIHVGWLLLAQIPIGLSFVLRVQRWSYIVRTSKAVPFGRLFSATQIGFLANFTLPLRVGEVIRAFLLGRFARIPFPKCMAMVALDRVTDVIGLVVVLTISALSFTAVQEVSIPYETFHINFPTFSTEYLQSKALLVPVLLFGLMLGLVLLYVKQNLILGISDRILGLISKRLASWVRGFLEHFAEGLHVFRSPSDIGKALFFTALVWACFVLSYALLTTAFHISYPWYTPVVMTAMVAVAISVPGAPGFVGQFHLPIVLCLAMLAPDTSASEAKAVAIVIHLVNFLWCVATGGYCLMREHVGLLALSSESAHAQQE